MCYPCFKIIDQTNQVAEFVNLHLIIDLPILAVCLAFTLASLVFSLD